MQVPFTIQQLDKLPPEWPNELPPSIRKSLIESARTIVVFDDDPTGTQTVYEVPVLTRFDGEQLVNELTNGPPLLFLLTNSRAMTMEQTKIFHRELAIKLQHAVAQTGRQVELISRSDSTLRGHYPLETDTLTAAWPEQAELTLLMPFFLEGGRLTIAGQHFVQEGEQLVPAHETPFALDPVFGFQHSFLPDYIEEKTDGRISASDVILISLDVIRTGGPNAVQAILDQAAVGAVCVADGVTDSDAQVVAAAVSQTSRSVLTRVAASYVRARAGLELRPLLTAAELQSEGCGGLVIVGSHVPRTTQQLQILMQQLPDCLYVELPVADLLKSSAAVIEHALANISQGLQANRDVVVFTSRELLTGPHQADNLRIANAVSQSLVQLVRRLDMRPRFLIAKGGITSSDIATAGLGVERARVAGAILPGVPVWQLGAETRFPGMYYVIFPGNVGDETALVQAISKLQRPTR